MTWCRGINSSNMMKTPYFYPWWQQYNTCLATPTMSLGEDSARLNPKLSISPIARKTNLVGQTKPIIWREIQKYLIMHKKSSEKTQIIFIDNLIINPQFIGSRQTHCKRILHRIELQEHWGEHCIEDQREWRSHLATSYGPVGMW